MVHWHGLAKLQMHAELTINILDEVTSAVGDQFCISKLKFVLPTIHKNFVRKLRLVVNTMQSGWQNRQEGSRLSKAVPH
jgi:hypothetical protein